MNSVTIKTLLDKHIGTIHDIGVFPRDMLDTPRRPKCAFVWNTDPHTKKGQHWVALYINQKNVGYYFDSYGKPPQHQEFITFMKKHCKRWVYNDVRVQDTDSTACGHFCVYFLIHMAFQCQDFIKTLVDQSDDNVVHFVHNLINCN